MIKPDALGSTRGKQRRASMAARSKIRSQEDTMEDTFLENVGTPVSGPNFEEFCLPEGDAVKKAQHTNHVLRAKRASLVELRNQYEAKIREYQYAIGEIDRELA